MEIFDCHLHVEKGLEKYDLTLSGANIIFNSIESYNKFSGQYPDFFHSLVFDLNTDVKFYNQLLENEKIRAIKIHSRLQKITESDHDLILKKLKLLNTNIPVIYDAFYFGSEIDYQPSLRGLINLIKAFPNKNFIIAHAGGYEVLKYFFHLKELNNAGFDLSFSLQYLADSSCRLDLIKLIKYIPSSRIFFGSDFPSASPSGQLEVFKTIAAEAGLNGMQINSIVATNWLEFTTIK